MKCLAYFLLMVGVEAERKGQELEPEASVGWIRIQHVFQRGFLARRRSRPSTLISVWIIKVLTYDILIFITSWSIIHETFLINSFVSTETQTEESTAEANYGSITKSHLGYKCHVGNEELNWYLNFLLYSLCHSPPPSVFPFEEDYLSASIPLTRIKVPIFTL